MSKITTTFRGTPSPPMLSFDELQNGDMFVLHSHVPCGTHRSDYRVRIKVGCESMLSLFATGCAVEDIATWGDWRHEKKWQRVDGSLEWWPVGEEKQ